VLAGAAAVASAFNLTDMTAVLPSTRFTIASPGLTVAGQALIDCGSQINVIDVALARSAGLRLLPLPSGVTFNGVGHEFTAEGLVSVPVLPADDDVTLPTPTPIDITCYVANISDTGYDMIFRVPIDDDFIETYLGSKSICSTTPGALVAPASTAWMLRQGFWDWRRTASIAMETDAVQSLALAAALRVVPERASWDAFRDGISALDLLDDENDEDSLQERVWSSFEPAPDFKTVDLNVPDAPAAALAALRDILHRRRAAFEQNSLGVDMTPMRLETLPGVAPPRASGLPRPLLHKDKRAWR
jgi:hypothetical protein